MLGASVGGQCLRAGLIDEIYVFVLPVLLGRGTPLYGAVEGEGRVNLEPISSISLGLGHGAPVRGGEVVRRLIESTFVLARR